MSELIFYAASPKAEAIRSAPKSVLDRCKETKCSKCGDPVMVIADAMEKTVELAEKVNRYILILCPECFSESTDNLEEVCILSHRDPEIRRLMKKYQAEKN